MSHTCGGSTTWSSTLTMVGSSQPGLARRRGASSVTVMRGLHPNLTVCQILACRGAGMPGRRRGGRSDGPSDRSGRVRRCPSTSPPLVAPERTAVVTSEVQNGVVGERSALPQLAEAAEEEMLPALRRLLPAARAAGVQVVHCTAYRRADGKGANTNARLFMGVRKSPVRAAAGHARRSRCWPTSAPSPRTSCSRAPTGSTRWPAPTSIRCCATSACAPSWSPACR